MQSRQLHCDGRQQAPPHLQAHPGEFDAKWVARATAQRPPSSESRAAVVSTKFASGAFRTVSGGFGSPFFRRIP